MNLLIDSQAVIWAADDPTRLGTDANVAMGNVANQCYLSMASLWEIGVKVSLGKLVLTLPFSQWMDTVLKHMSLVVLPITKANVVEVIGLPFHHRDPFDRMIIAQAKVENLTIVSNDLAFDSYAVPRIW